MSQARLDPAPLLPGLHRLAGRLLEGVEPPPVAMVRQRLDPPVVEDVDAAARQGVRQAVAGVAPRRVAVGVGSRGIAGIGRIVQASIAALRELGFDPFVVPAMGSHGAATAEGQADLLAGYGVDRALIRATMDTVVVGEVDGVPVHLDRNVAEAGAVFVVNRVKPHTSFRGPVESGLAKMCAIGLGKQAGARHLHSRGPAGLRDLIPAAARLLADQGILLGGLAIVENQRDQTALVQGLTAREVGAGAEAALLAQARGLMPGIPFDDLDVLVIDRIGKDVSGAGIDTNVVGRLRVIGQPEAEPHRVTAIVALDLTDASHGNAMGIGTADFTTARLLARIDFEALYTNSLTAGVIGIQRMVIPCVMPTDLAAVCAAISSRGREAPLRLAWIADTLHTEVLAVSPPLLEEARSRPELEVVGEPAPMPFDAGGRLRPLGTAG
ncbi:MAG TPA: DUF2088 domain-containing protein [Candidatus Dormibacteraeota bacterium]|nr:DUF2088 domain-containing protein [Candidatus Dormibacteraeota bacterium]